MSEETLQDVSAHQVVNALLDRINQQLLGKPTQIQLALTCLLAQGHLLIEDLPGTGKTTLAKCLATSLGLSYQRVQFTSDLLPSDIIGVSIFNRDKHAFDFQHGPIFSQVLLADEINRAGPKTQSALLEAMEEQQVSVDGTTHSLPSPFFVIGTQNPLTQSGTHPLPESQLDRFLMRINLGYPDFDAEKLWLTHQSLQSDTAGVGFAEPPLLTPNRLLEMQATISSLHIADPVLSYLLRLIHFTRSDEFSLAPLSPRASIALLRASKAWAFVQNRDYVTQEDIQLIFPYVAEHRFDTHIHTGHQHSERVLNQVSVT